MFDHASVPYFQSIVDHIPLDADLAVRIAVGMLAGYALLRVAGAIGSLIGRALAWSLTTALLLALLLGGMPGYPDLDAVRQFVEQSLHTLSR